MQACVGVEQKTIWPEPNDVSWTVVSHTKDITLTAPTDRIAYEPCA